MAGEELKEPWGQLISAGIAAGTEEERVPLLGSGFLIGRDKDAELVVAGNRCVSSRHCLLERDKEGGKWVSDLSSNGTLLNGAKLQKHKRVRLRDGDIISVVFRRDKTDSNVTYKFQDLRPSVAGSVWEEEEEEGERGEGEGDETFDLTLVDPPAISGVGEDTASGEEDSEEEVSERGTNRRLTEEERSERGTKRKLTEEESLAPEGKRPAVDEDRAPGERLPESASGAEENGGDGESGGASLPGVVKTGSIEQSLICQICQEIFHDCISLQPCMHCYCGGCYSQWMKNSNKCPSCRCGVERINRNHLVNNLVDAFLRANPGKGRAEEDLKELDQKNTITKDMLYPKQRRYSDDDNDSNSDTDQSDSPSAPPFPGGPSAFFSSVQGIASNFGGRPIPGLFHCRQCPTYAGPHHPSHPPPPPFTCSPSSTNHVLCQCCIQPMPDRRVEGDFSIPPRNVTCVARCSATCIGAALDRAAVDVSTFSEDYLQSQSKTERDMLRDCCSRLDSRQYNCSYSRVSSGSVVCHRCALTSFKELAYRYRSDIPASDLPESVRSRPDCHWGKNCRTQKHNTSHARRYNHICGQTRSS